MELDVAYELENDDNDGEHLHGLLRVIVSRFGDVFVSVGYPGDRKMDANVCRVRPYSGGGHHERTRLALVDLAEAIRLDNLDWGA